MAGSSATMKAVADEVHVLIKFALSLDLSSEEALQDVPEGEIESNWDQIVDK